MIVAAGAEVGLEGWDSGNDEVLPLVLARIDLAARAGCCEGSGCVRTSFDVARSRRVCPRLTPSSGSVTLLPVPESRLLSVRWLSLELGWRDRSVAERDADEPVEWPSPRAADRSFRWLVELCDRPCRRVTSRFCSKRCGRATGARERPCCASRDAAASTWGGLRLERSVPLPLVVGWSDLCSRFLDLSRLRSLCRRR